MRQPQHVEYGIVAVRYQEKPRRIIEVKARPSSLPQPQVGPDAFASAAHEVVLNREEIIFWKGLGTRFFTVTFRGAIAVKGAEVLVVDGANGNKYLRTKADKTEEDNLGELPEF